MPGTSCSFRSFRSRKPALERRDEKVGNYFFPIGHDGGSWPAGQRSGPADPDAARLWQWDCRDGGRSLSALRPGSLRQCSALARLITLPHSCLQKGMAGWVLAGPTVPGRALSAAADLYALGQWSAARSHLARSSRSVGPQVSIGWVGPVLWLFMQ